MTAQMPAISSSPELWRRSRAWCGSRRPAVHPAIVDGAVAIERLLESVPEHEIPRRVAGELARLATCDDLLEPAQRGPGRVSYRRHLLHRDPQGRFTLMALVWRPGQGTPVHGHSAWCAVSVLEGYPTVARFDYEPGYGALPRGEICCEPGDVDWESPGVSRPHRICNAGDTIAITLHCYGLDLAEDPTAINLPV